jgi:uncharacterized alkaline shock family protein YloU
MDSKKQIGGKTMNSATSGMMNTNLGNVQIDNDVIAKYAGSSAVECFGIVGMAAVNVKEGFAKLLKRENIRRGVGVTVSSDNKITIDLHVIVSYGVSISAVTDNLISNVKYKVEEFAGLSVERINVYVEGVRVID